VSLTLLQVNSTYSWPWGGFCKRIILPIRQSETFQRMNPFQWYRTLALRNAVQLNYSGLLKSSLNRENMSTQSISHQANAVKEYHTRLNKPDLAKQESNFLENVEMVTTLAGGFIVFWVIPRLLIEVLDQSRII
jgi:hypothetical protein